MKEREMSFLHKREVPGEKNVFGLPKTQRITGNADIREAYQVGRKTPGRFMVMWIKKRGDEDPARLAVVVSKRSLRRSVDRSRAKRLLRESFRLNKNRLIRGIDMVLVARRDIFGRKRGEVEADLLKLAEKADVLRD